MGGGAGSSAGSAVLGVGTSVTSGAGMILSLRSADGFLAPAATGSAMSAAGKVGGMGMRGVGVVGVLVAGVVLGAMCLA